MKRIVAMAFAACIFSACGNNNNEGTDYDDSIDMATGSVPPVDHSLEGYTPAEGDVTYNTGRLQVYRGDRWEDANEDVRLNNGITVYRDGRATRDNTDYQWEEGYVVDSRGNVWDRTGNAIGDAWDATKHGVKKAGQAIGNTAERVGDKAKDAVDGKDDKDNR